ncbi:hypothetical protein AXG93_2190s1210 [Marchantia polymorpha subsp. ruderalis]|uniref:Uncharacterized protein n=1 Tax=Marchantia polymorpha subsp. ruderalis TaxID=1480154 RepID=A0A176WIA0_MARPO|nr:hypothetical protein AXG93_2190s1210 [Marchantia polymorpha subsp. ruderalis]
MGPENMGTCSGARGGDVPIMAAGRRRASGNSTASSAFFLKAEVGGARLPYHTRCGCTCLSIQSTGSTFRMTVGLLPITWFLAIEACEFGLRLRCCIEVWVRIKRLDSPLQPLQPSFSDWATDIHSGVSRFAPSTRLSRLFVLHFLKCTFRPSMAEQASLEPSIWLQHGVIWSGSDMRPKKKSQTQILGALRIDVEAELIGRERG